MKEKFESTCHKKHNNLAQNEGVAWEFVTEDLLPMYYHGNRGYQIPTMVSICNHLNIKISFETSYVINFLFTALICMTSESVELIILKMVFTPQPLRAVGVLFSPMVSGWAGGRREEVC